jgi:uncharacterized protein (DUF2225 family)
MKVKTMIRCPVCNGEFEAEPLKAWSFRFYKKGPSTYLLPFSYMR